MMRSPWESGWRSALIAVDVTVTELWGYNSPWSNRVCSQLPAFPSCLFIWKALMIYMAEAPHHQFPLDADIVLSPGFKYMYINILKIMCYDRVAWHVVWPWPVLECVELSWQVCERVVWLSCNIKICVKHELLAICYFWAQQQSI